MPFQAFPLKVKSLSDSGAFEGWAATFDVDEGGDQILPGAFQQTLRSDKQRPLFYEHRSAVGTVQLEEQSQGLYAYGQLTLGNSLARDVYELVKSKAVTSMSIGYVTVKEAFAGTIRQLAELKLYEVSLTSIPMNPAAAVLAVKSMREQQRVAIMSAAEDLRTFYSGIHKR